MNIKNYTEIYTTGLFTYFYYLKCLIAFISFIKKILQEYYLLYFFNNILSLLIFHIIFEKNVNKVVKKKCKYQLK